MPEPPRPSALVDGRYRLLEPLGSGSMGYVHRALDIFLERPCAIKFIDPVMAKDQANIERFHKEAKALARVKHPNVVEVYAFGPHAGSVFFAMEYVAGRSLESIVDELAARGETLPLERALEIVRAMASGLTAVHQQGIVHRDVKPSNVVVENETGRPVLIDFGLARRRSASNPRMSITAGTPSYMAPEQSRDPDGTKVSFRADIYALACTTFELLTGKSVFDGTDVYDILLKHLSQTPPLLSVHEPELEPLDAAVARALAKAPDERQESCVAFAKALDAGYEKVVKARAAVATSKTRAMVGPEERVLALVADDALKRRLGKVLEKALEGAGRTPAIEWASSVEEAWEALRRDAARILVIDDADLEPPAPELVANIRRLPGGASTTILVLSRDFAALRAALASHAVRDVLPKPLNPQMLTAAIERIVARRSLPGV